MPADVNTDTDYADLFAQAEEAASYRFFDPGSLHNQLIAALRTALTERDEARAEVTKQAEGWAIAFEAGVHHQAEIKALQQRIDNALAVKPGEHGGNLGELRMRAALTATETTSKRVLLTEPHDGHPDTETCPGCPHTTATETSEQ